MARGFLIKSEEGCKIGSKVEGPTRLAADHPLEVSPVKDADNSGLSRFAYCQSELISRVEASNIHARHTAGFKATQAAFKKEGNSSPDGCGSARLVGHHPATGRAAGPIPGQGTCLGGGFGPRLGHKHEATDRCFPLSPSLSLSL